jgi:D-xylose transport system permease protein
MSNQVETAPMESTAGTPARGPSKLRRRFSGSLIRSYSLMIAIAAVWIIFDALTGGIFLEPRNFSNLVRQTAVTGILSVGMVMVIVAAEIDLSVGSLVGLSGMAAVMVQTVAHLGLLASLVVGLGVGLAVGALQGWLTAYARIPSFIVTLGGLLAWRGAAQGISGGNTYPVEIPSFTSLGQSYTSRTTGIVLMLLSVAGVVWVVLHRRAMQKRHGLESWSAAGATVRIGLPSILIVVFVIVLNTYAGIPIPVLLLVVIAFAGAFLMANTTFGRRLYAVGGNPEAARLSGINVQGQVLCAFCSVGLLSGVAGIIYAARLGSAGPDAGTLLELDAIAACVIGGASLLGGRGTVVGACLGALFMASLDNGMSLKDVPDFVQNIVKGGILVIAVGLDVLGRQRD